MVIQLSSSDAREATVPATVTIAAGADAATFNIVSIDDQVFDGSKNVTLSAAAPGLSAASAALTVSDQVIADLVISSVTAPASAQTDAFVDVTFTATNRGTQEAASSITQRLLLSRDANLGDDTVLGNYVFTGILQPTAPLNQFTQTVRVRLPQAAGDYWFIAIADANDSVVEAFESNNARAIAQPIRVVAAYSATASTNIELAQAGTVVPIQGAR